jgi:hypothetical protein
MRDGLPKETSIYPYFICLYNFKPIACKINVLRSRVFELEKQGNSKSSNKC